MASNPLVVRFATDTDKAKSAVADLAGSIAGQMAKAAVAIKGAQDNLEIFGKVLSGLRLIAVPALTALLGFVALKAMLDSVARAAEEAEKRVQGLVKTAATARGLGVGTTTLQGAQAFGLEGALGAAQRASQVSIGTGDDPARSAIEERLRQHLKAGNITQGNLDALTGAPDQEARIRVILNLIDELRSKGEELAALDIAGKFFGADFEEKLRGGVDKVNEMRRALDGLKTAHGERIIPPEEFELAQRINAELEKTKAIYAEALRPVQEDIARWQLQQGLAAAEFNREVAEATASALALYNVFRDIANALENMGNASFFKRFNETMERWGLAGNYGLTGQGVEVAPPGGFKPLGPDVPQGFRWPGTMGAQDKSKNLPGAAKAEDDTESKTALERYLDNLIKANALAQTEVENVGKSNQERETALALTRARVAAEQDVRDGNRENKNLTAEEVANVQHLAEVYSRAKDQALNLNQAIRQNAEATRYFGGLMADALGNMIFNGAKAADVARQLAENIGRAALNAAFTGQGPLAGILGTASQASTPNQVGGLAGLLQGLFSVGGGGGTVKAGPVASGGPVIRGQPYTVGEMGREIFVPDQNGRVVPVGPGQMAQGPRVVINNMAGRWRGRGDRQEPAGPGAAHPTGASGGEPDGHGRA
jgi:hypothetical protein